MATCGQGSQVRNVYCMSALDEAVPDQSCTDLHGAAPESEQSCPVPCDDQCDLSEWSDWTECTVTCGKKGGTQIRTRQIQGKGPVILNHCDCESDIAINWALSH